MGLREKLAAPRVIFTSLLLNGLLCEVQSKGRLWYPFWLSTFLSLSPLRFPEALLVGLWSCFDPQASSPEIRSVAVVFACDGSSWSLLSLYYVAQSAMSPVVLRQSVETAYVVRLGSSLSRLKCIPALVSRIPSFRSAFVTTRSILPTSRCRLSRNSLVGYESTSTLFAKVTPGTMTIFYRLRITSYLLNVLKVLFARTPFPLNEDVFLCLMICEVVRSRFNVYPHVFSGVK